MQMTMLTNRVSTTLIMAMFLGMLSVASSTQADWLQFRGPRSSGVAPTADLPTVLSSESIKWSIDLPGRGLSSPLVIGDNVIVTAASGPDQSQLHIICLSAKDGSKRWDRRFWATGRTMTHPKTCVAAPTPVSDGKYIYATYSSNDLFCLDLKGNLVWLRGLTHDYPNASNSLGMSSSLLLVDGVLIAQVESDAQSFTAGIDSKTGKNLWKVDRPKAANWTSPIAMKQAGREVALIQASTGVTAYEPRTGKKLWEYKGGASTIPSSTVAGDLLFSPSNGTTALRPVPGEDEPKQVWRRPSMRPGTASAVVVGKHVHVVNGAGVITAATMNDGETVWRTRTTGPYSATPVATGTHMYLVNEKGSLQVVKLGKEGSVVGQLDLNETILGSPAISGNAMFIRSDGHLWKIAK